MEILTSKLTGDATDGEIDKAAGIAILRERDKFEKQSNFTTRKRHSRRDCDRFLMSRLCFDGEVIARRVRNFPNECGFSWQLIDPDYLDHNLNRTEPNGNITKLGIELDGTWKFPVAYWFLNRRPNLDAGVVDYRSMPSNRYIRVPAEEVIHIFIQDEDAEQVRGWPWVFSAAVNLFRMEKFEEASLINAAIGASKAGFFKKTTPEGFIGDLDNVNDHGEIVDQVSPGEWIELPWNVEPVKVETEYPDAEFDPFRRAMLMGISASLGSSYSTLSNDYSQVNFSSMRPAINEEREQWMWLQEFWIEHWKRPEFSEWLWWGLMNRSILLPIAKFEKFDAPRFTGRRWPYINPLQDLQAKQLEIDNCICSVTSVIEESGRDAEAVFREIAEEKRLFEELEIERIRNTFQVVGEEPPAPVMPPAGPPKK
jgi:lambda family phage portal protein